MGKGSVAAPEAAPGEERAPAGARLLPGLGLAAAVMLLSMSLSDWLGPWFLRLQGIDPSGAGSPISGVMIAIVVGIIIRNTVTLPAAVQPGIEFSMKTVLRAGIVLVGIKLSLLDVLRLGAWGVPIVAVSIGAGMVLVTWINNRLGLPRRLGTLIAAGTGICGVTAIVSVAPVIGAERKEVAYAVANITLFGLLGMFAYPYVAPTLVQTSEQVGLLLGIAIHETAQVVGAALTYREVFDDDVAFRVATVTKLTRNLFLAAVVPLLGLYYLRTERERGADAGAGSGSAGVHGGIMRFIPAFVLGFLVMAVVRTVGDATAASGGAAFGVLDPGAWAAAVRQLGDVWGSKYLLGTAMAAVGLGTRLEVFRGVGLKPFVVGLFGALLVGVVGLVAVLVLGPFVRL